MNTEDKQCKIYIKTLELLMRFGVKSQNMDDISRSLRISKKTLYNYAKDKNDLVDNSIKVYIDQIQKDVTEVIKTGENAIDENYKISQYVFSKFKTMHPSVLFDLEKYHPEALKHLEDHKHNFVLNCVKNNLKRGVEEGLYRKNIHVNLVALLHVFMTDHLHTGDLLTETGLTFPQAYLEHFRYHVRGIASDAGIEYLNKQIKNGNYEF